MNSEIQFYTVAYKDRTETEIDGKIPKETESGQHDNSIRDKDIET